MSVNVRQFIVDELALPITWKVIAEQRLPATIETETAIIKHDRIEPLPEAPIGGYRNAVVLGVFIPNKDLARAESRLDDAVAEILTRVERHASISWREAQKVVTPDGLYPGWEIELTVITQTTLEEE